MSCHLLPHSHISRNLDLKQRWELKPDTAKWNAGAPRNALTHCTTTPPTQILERSIPTFLLSDSSLCTLKKSVWRFIVAGAGKFWICWTIRDPYIIPSPVILKKKKVKEKNSCDFSRAPLRAVEVIRSWSRGFAFFPEGSWHSHWLWQWQGRVATWCNHRGSGPAKYRAK